MGWGNTGLNLTGQPGAKWLFGSGDPGPSNPIAGSVAGDFYLNTDTGDVLVCLGALVGWEIVTNIRGAPGAPGSTSWNGLADIPSTFPPAAHAHPVAQISDSTAVGRSLVTAADAAAARAAIGAGTSSLALGTTASTACAGNDSRLSDARTPTAHTHNASDISDGALTVGRGGTGAQTASAARTNLGAAEASLMPVQMTQAAYNALGSGRPARLYAIVG